MKKYVAFIPAILLLVACGSTSTKTSSPRPTIIVEGWSNRNDHYYKLTDSMTWSEVEAQAVKWGGHLVTINDSEEELWLKNQFGYQEYFWIGFNDIVAEGIWVWANGETITYTNWCEGEPNNLDVVTNREEDSAILNWGANGTYGDCWNDILSDDKRRSIVEKFP
jgi:hypothetical protein